MLGISLELGRVTLLELFPFARLVTKPFSERRAGRNLLEPKIDLGLRLRQTSGPESIHEDAFAIALLGSLIDPLNIYVIHW